MVEKQSKFYSVKCCHCQFVSFHIGGNSSEETELSRFGVYPPGAENPIEGTCTFMYLHYTKEKNCKAPF